MDELRAATPTHPPRPVAAGFTIIEVLIVLAIAGLIMLIVFLAVPALQRNSRNTQYRNEASRILSATQELLNNNGGTLPQSSDASTILANANSPKNITTLNVTNPGTTAAVAPTTSAATLETGVACGTVGGATLTPVSGGSARQLTLIYAVETSSGGVSAQCIRS
jgi:prepilin-type N-terminal cleavage/methylation domain-containing protein